jgi:hypothetical protein
VCDLSTSRSQSLSQDITLDAATGRLLGTFVSDEQVIPAFSDDAGFFLSGGH